MALDALADFALVLGEHPDRRAEFESLLGPDLIAELAAAHAAVQRAVEKVDAQRASDPTGTAKPPGR